MKQVAELQDGTLFVHSYEPNVVYVTVRQVCEGGKDTGILDYVAIRAVAFKMDGKWHHYSKRDEEHCNPAATVHEVTLDYTTNN